MRSPFVSRGTPFGKIQFNQNVFTFSVANNAFVDVPMNQMGATRGGMSAVLATAANPTATGLLITPESGLYMLTGTSYWVPTTGGQTRFMRLRANGTQVDAVEILGNSNNVNGTAVSLTTFAALSKGDRLDMHVHQNSGAALQLTAGTFLAAIRVD